MITHVAGVQLPEQTILALARAEAEEQAEQREREAARADWEDRCQQAAPLVRQLQEAAMLAGEREVARAGAEAQRARQQREAQLEDLRIDLVRQGRRWRTVGEILADARGDPW